MNSREIVLRTLEYRDPERVAASFPAPYWNDLCNTSYVYEGYDPTWCEVSPGLQEYVDEWGNTWARLDTTSKGEAVRGVLPDWAALDSLRLPYVIFGPDTPVTLVAEYAAKVVKAYRKTGGAK